jgi:hypothetical protein
MFTGMRAIALASLLALAVPATARAGPLIEGSVGVGWQLSPDITRTPVNLMVAPGWGFVDGILKLQLGLVGSLGDVQNSKFDLELRPMVTVSPPLFPLYVRAILAVQNLTEHSGPITWAYGGALGLRFGVLGAGAFIEAGVLPRNVTVQTISGTGDEFRWFGEARAGAYWEF